MNEMELNASLSQPIEYNFNETVQQLESFRNQIQEMEENAVELKLKSALMAIELANRIETIDSIESMDKCNKILAHIESKQTIQSNDTNVVSNENNSEDNGIKEQN